MKDQIIMDYLEEVLREMILESIMENDAPVTVEQLDCRVTSAIFNIAETRREK